MNRLVFVSGIGCALIARPVSARSTNARIATIARGMPGTLGVYGLTLAPGPPLAAYNSSERFPTASIIKVLIMTTAYAAVDAQPDALSEEIVFHNGDLVGGSDFMSTVSAGQRFTVGDLIVPMITVSDNTAANLLIGHFGFAAINATGKRAGLRHTHLAHRFVDVAPAGHNENVSTPADMARLLYLIASGAHEGTATIVSSQHCRAMVGVMLRQTDRDGIPAALPPNTSIANKTGEVDGTRNDIAVISPYGADPLILAIMTKEVDDYAAAYGAIHAVTRSVYASAARASLSGGR